MLAGILDPDSSTDPGRSRDRLAAAFGPDAAARAVVAGPLVVTADLITAGCALQGPIYNLPSVAEELGIPAAAPAPEIVAEAYRRWGDDMLHRLRGAFALAAWADDGRRVLLAQDQVGVGAVFLHEGGRELVFGSEVREVLALLPTRPAPDEVYVVRTLAGAFIFEGRTPYEGVRRLGVGRRLVVRDGERERQRYWYPRYEPPLTIPRAELAAEFQRTLRNAVETRVAEPDTVGVMMSGGFDSSSVAAAAAAVRGSGRPPVRGYSASFPGHPKMDETDLLDALRDQLDIENIRFQIHPGGSPTLALEFARDWKLPLSGPGWVIEHALSRRAAADGVSVLLDGQGGDEVFGMSPYLLADLLRRGRLPTMIDLARNNLPGGGTGRSWRKVAGTLRRFALAGAAPRLHRALERKSAAGAGPDWLSEGGARLLDETSDDFEDMSWAKGHNGPLWWRYLAYLLTDGRDVAGIGDYARHRSGWVGIEARPPLADVELVELALRIPPEYAWDPHLNRPFAREAMGGLLPDEVRLSRHKSNLGPLYHAGMSGPDLPLIRRLLTSEAAETRRWARPEGVERMLAAPPATGERGWLEWLGVVWGLVSIECWLRTESDPGFADRLLEDEVLEEPEYLELGPF